MKSSFSELIKRLDTAKKRINDLKIDQKKFTQREKATTTTKAKQHQEEWIQELWNNFEQCYIRVIEISEGAERQDEAEEILEDIMADNFQKLMTNQNYRSKKLIEHQAE